MRRLAIFAAAVLTLILAVPALAESDPPLGTQKTAIQPGNYCLECHSAFDKRLEAPTAWRGGHERLAVNPCPDAARIDEEVYYSERLLLALERARTDIDNNGQALALDAKIAAASQGYSRLLDAPVTSLNAFIADAALLRYRLGKYYQQINQINNVENGQSVLIFAGIVTLVLLAALVWGWLNIRKALPSARGLDKFKVSAAVVVFLTCILLIFALPIFRVFAEPVVSPGVEEQERQAVLDSSKRSGDAAERALARVWELGRIAAAWQKFDPGKAENSLKSAQEAQREAQNNLAALWGDALAAREAAVGSSLALEQSGNISDQLISNRSRAWALSLMAEEWVPVDAKKTTAILEDALMMTNRAAGIYRDLDLRRIAVVYGSLNPGRAADILARISDPAVRSWGYRDLAVVSKDAGYYQKAAAAGRLVEDPVLRARVLGETAAASKDKTLVVEALAALSGVEGAGLAYNLADLAAATGDAGIADRIGSGYPGAKAYAYYILGQSEKAWEAARQIIDPFERGRAQAAIAVAWKNSSAAEKIEQPILRDLARRDLVRKTGDAGLINSIQNSYYRVQSLTTLAQFKPAWEEGQNLSEKYPLLELGLAWNRSDPAAALAVVEKLDRETDKARLLREAAISSSAVFDRAVQMAEAARQSGDPLSAVEALMALGKNFPNNNQLAEAALSRAFETAVKISIK